MKTTKIPNQKVTFLEDLLQQEEFTLEDLRAAKLKHPVLSWVKKLYLSFKYGRSLD
jgi:hypothetical protein